MFAIFLCIIVLFAIFPYIGIIEQVFVIFSIYIFLLNLIYGRNLITNDKKTTYVRDNEKKDNLGLIMAELLSNPQRN